LEQKTVQLDNLSAFPDLIIGKLNEWSVTQVTGDDRTSFLHGQLSCNIQNLAPGQHTLSAHCDAKGKTWSVLRVLAMPEAYWLIQKSSVQAVQQPQLTKYSVFSKVTIEDAPERALVAVMGQQARNFITQTYGEAIARNGGLIPDGFCVHYPSQPMRYLVILPHKAADALIAHAPDTVHVDAIWDGLDIVAGIPSLEAATSNQFIPQALNLQCLNGISFTKGCYSGQEVIARAKYRGTNKRATLRFAGQSEALAEVGADIEIKMGENWRRCGTILSLFRRDDGHTELLAVAPIDSDPQACYRIAGQKGALALVHLPYSLDEA
jgi:folate-binding protein YgfZ